MKQNTLNVAETFFSIQGEGQTAGIPAVFLRLSGCNLLCNAKWRCDTIEVWQKGQNTGFDRVLSREQREALARGAHLVITGGEPLLQQLAIVDFLLWFASSFGWRPIVEVETNGTICPSEDMKKIVTYWNISPKLSNSGEPVHKRINEVALAMFFNLVGVRSVMYKFVINDEGDALEMIQDYAEHINFSRIWLMPAGASQQELAITRPLVADMCKQHLFKYSDRLQVAIWNKATGV